jgi:hypothetical protein
MNRMEKAKSNFLAPPWFLNLDYPVNPVYFDFAPPRV